MPQLDDVRHELFCRELSRGCAQAEAYEAAGFNRSSANASTLARKPHIKARVDELVKERLQREGKEDFTSMESANEALADIDATGTVSKEWVLKQLVENIRMSREAGQYAASNKGLELLGKEIGLFNEKPGGGAEKAEEKKANDEKENNRLGVDMVTELLKAVGNGSNNGPAKMPSKRLSKDRTDDANA